MQPRVWQSKRPSIDVQFFIFQRRHELFGQPLEEGAALSIPMRVEFEEKLVAARELVVQARTMQVLPRSISRHRCACCLLVDGSVVLAPIHVLLHVPARDTWVTTAARRLRRVVTGEVLEGLVRHGAACAYAGWYRLSFHCRVHRRVHRL